jgi:TolA-binding protein
MNQKVAALAIAGLISLTSITLTLPAGAVKHYTITQRQEMLNKEVTAGQKANELTSKEADKLRDRLSDVTNRIEKMKANNAGKLSYKDEGKVEKDLNAISVDMQKQKLAKRVQSK